MKEERQKEREEVCINCGSTNLESVYDIEYNTICLDCGTYNITVERGSNECRV